MWLDEDDDAICDAIDGSAGPGGADNTETVSQQTIPIDDGVHDLIGNFVRAGGLGTEDWGDPGWQHGTRGDPND